MERDGGKAEEDLGGGKEGDDDVVLGVASLSLGGASSGPPAGSGLHLDLAEAAEPAGDGKSGEGGDAHRDAELPQEQPLPVLLDLPDGSTVDHTFKLGHTVEFVKSFVEGEVGIPMSEQSLYLDDKLMMDPLCLSDFPEAKEVMQEVLDANEAGEGAAAGKELYIRVDGPMASDSKK